MSITAICGCKNEQDIVEPFVRHTLKFCDRLIISDNSLDDTKRILVLLCTEFPQLHVCNDSYFAYDQKQIMTRLFRMAAEDSAKFIVPLDVDEFIGAPNRETFEKHLSEIPEGGCGMTPWRTYVVTAPGAADSLKAILFRRKVESPQYWKCILRLGSLTAGDVIVEMGNHEMSSPTGRSIQRVNLELPLFHVPVRSYDQLVARIVVNWMALVTRDPNIGASGAAFHVRDLFQKVVVGEVTENNIAQLSAGYAQNERQHTWDDLVEDEHGIDCTRKYSTGAPESAISLIAKEWEKSLAK